MGLQPPDLFSTNKSEEKKPGPSSRTSMIQVIAHLPSIFWRPVFRESRNTRSCNLRQLHIRTVWSTQTLNARHSPPWAPPCPRDRKPPAGAFTEDRPATGSLVSFGWTAALYISDLRDQSLWVCWLSVYRIGSGESRACHL